ncbi:MAG: hypothetical protein WEC15_02930 [Flavobacteriales bacterium]
MNHIHIPLLALLVACGPTPQEEAGIPQAFQDKTILKDIKGSALRSEYGSDLVEELFAEAVQRDTALARLVLDLDSEPRLHAEGTEAFHLFNEHIAGYHGDAQQHYNSIQDTVLRVAATRADSTAQARFQQLVAGHRRTLSKYDSLAIRNQDLLSLLKLRLSLNVLEAYRDKNLPDKALLDRELDRVRKLEQRMNQELGL